MNDRTENEGRPTLGTSIDPFAVGNRGSRFVRLLPLPGCRRQRPAVSDAVLAAAIRSPRCRWHEPRYRRVSVCDAGDRTRYNAPYSDASDLETRLSRQLALSAQREWTRGGRHAIKGGYDWLRSQRTGGNEPSSTDYVFDADYTLDPRTELPALDSSGHLVPSFVPGNTRIEHSLPVRGSVLDVRTQALYAQDIGRSMSTGRWTLARATNESPSRRRAESPA